LGLDEGFAGKRFICAQESAEFRVARGFACSVISVGSESVAGAAGASMASSATRIAVRSRH
jgi:hypothetical protein